MEVTCPYCGAEAVEMTTSEDHVRHFMCLSRERHRFTEEFEKSPERDPLIILP